MAITFPANPANGETHTHNGQIYVYNSTRGYWLLKKSADVSVQQAQRSTFVATASQTTHSVVYDAGSPVVVSVNGVMLNPSDFTAENGTSITFETALTVNDEVDIVFYQPTKSNLTRHSVSDTAPSNASSGDLWFNSANLKTYVYYDDGSSAQWVVTNPLGADGADGAAGADGSSVAVYANFAAFVNGNTEGDFAFAQDTKALYIWDGTEWDRISSGVDESPIITTEPPTTHSLNNDGTTSTITMVAEDPEGFDIEYGIRYNTSGNTLPDQLAAATSINQNTGVYTFTPTTTESNEGTFTARLIASDGNKTTTRLIDFDLAFLLLNENFEGASGTSLTTHNSNFSLHALGSGSGTAILDGSGGCVFTLNGNYDFGPQVYLNLTGGVQYTFEINLTANNFGTNRFVMEFNNSAIAGEVNGTGVKTKYITPSSSGNYQFGFRTATTASSGSYALGYFKVYETP